MASKFLPTQANTALLCKRLLRLYTPELWKSSQQMCLPSNIAIGNETLDIASELMNQKSTRFRYYNAVSALPGTPLAFATALSLRMQVPILTREVKEHNYPEFIVNAEWAPNEYCLVIQDVLNSGTKLCKVVEDMNLCGVQCHDLGVLIDNEKGGVEYLAEKGITVHSLFTLNDLRKFSEENNESDVESSDSDEATLTTDVV